MKEKTVRVILVLWDECMHIPPRKAKQEADRLLKHLKNGLAGHELSCTLPIHDIPMICVGGTSTYLKGLRFFRHNGMLVPYSGRLKDLALVKWCTSGLEDQSGRRSHVVVDACGARSPYLNIDPQEWLVVFVTADNAHGMTSAVAHINKDEPSANLFVKLAVPQKAVRAKDRSVYVGEQLGAEFARRLTRTVPGAWSINIDGDAPETKVRKGWTVKEEASGSES